MQRKILTLCGAVYIALAAQLAYGAEVAKHPVPQYQGKVLVLLAGMPGCPGTEAATVFLKSYSKEKPAEVEILRLDVPPPGGSLGVLTNDVGIPRQVDEGRKIATSLEFFFYPTTYLLDRDGVVRFAGACEPESLKKMVGEMAAEKAGAEKKMYTPPLIALGTAVTWSGTSLAGEKVTLDKLRGAKATLLFFGALSCPFSNKELMTLPKLANDYKDKGVAVIVVTHSAADDDTKLAHKKSAPGLTVVADPDDKIGKDVCKVPAVPFCLVLDAAGKVTARQPFTEGGARSAVDVLLGVSPAVTVPASGAG